MSRVNITSSLLDSIKQLSIPLFHAYSLLFKAIRRGERKYLRANRYAKGLLITGGIIKEKGITLVSCQKAPERGLP